MATYQTSIDHQSGSNQLSVNQLAGTLIRCTLLALVFTVSTGPLIRKLLSVTLEDCLTLFVGVFWLLGDILPSIALLVLFHDVLIIRKRDDSELVRWGDRAITLLDVIVGVLVVLYSGDIVISFSCYIGYPRSKKECMSFLEKYRSLFFHIQIALAILYLIKPWRWTELDLRNILSYFERFYRLALKVTHSLLKVLDTSPRRFRDDPLPEDQSQLSEQNLPESRITRQGSHRSITSTTTLLPHMQSCPECDSSSSSSDDTIRPSSSNESPQQTIPKTRRVYRKRTTPRPRVNRRRTVKRAKPLVVVRMPRSSPRFKSKPNSRTRKRATNRTKIRTRTRARSGSALTRQTVLVRRSARRRPVSSTARPESTRTVNLNLNMN